MVEISTSQRLLFRLIRQSKGYSIENVAKAMQLSKGAVSKMENGKKTFSPQHFELGMNHMGVQFRNISQKELQEIKSLVAKFIDGAYFSDRHQKQWVREQFLRLDFNRRKDFHEGYFYLLLLEMLLEIDQLPEFMATERSQKALVERMRFLGKSILEFSADLQMIYAYMVMFWLTRSHDWELVERFYQSFQLDQEIKEFPGLTALIAIYRVNALVVIPSEKSNPYLLVCQLRQLVHSEGNYLRLIYLDFIETVYLMTTGNYGFAKKKLEQLQKAIWRFNLESLKRPVIEKLIWCNLMTQDFEAALEKIKELQQKFGYFYLENNLPFGVYCAYRQGNLDQANDILLHLQKNLSDKKDLEILQIFDYLLKMAPLPLGFERRKWLNIFCTRCEAYWSKLLKKLPKNREEAIFFIQIQLYEMETVQDYSEANRLCRTLDLLRHARPELESLLNFVS